LAKGDAKVWISNGVSLFGIVRMEITTKAADIEVRGVLELTASGSK
jgi:hypothetical protein